MSPNGSDELIRIRAVAGSPAAPGAWTALVRTLGSAFAAIWWFCRRKPLGAIGGIIVIAMLLMALFAERVAPYGYDDSIRGARMQAPNLTHWLGTDNLSRDLWSRVVYGARVSLTVGFGTVLLGTLVATVIGVASGYFGGIFDMVIQCVVDAWISFPFFVIAISVLAVLGPGLLNVILSIAVVVAATNSRVIRGATISAMQNAYVEAARAMGAGHARIILRHILPNIAPTIIILATIGLGGVILAESALSFLGFGVPPPYPSWGAMLSGSGRTYMYHAPWMAFWPGVAVSLAVFGFNMLGDALRDVLDPRLRGSGGPTTMAAAAANGVTPAEPPPPPAMPSPATER
jgi:peptide/nickel transport system permease protein